MTLPAKGFRFPHKRILSTLAFDGKTPQICVVTRVTSSAIYYRPVYDYGNREELGGGEWVTPERWHVVCDVPS